MLASSLQPTPRMLRDVPRTSVSALTERYDGLLIDAYGVLVDASGVLPGAVPWIEALERSGRPYLILTNDASRLPESCARRYQQLGLPIVAEQVVTSGSLVADDFAQHGLAHAGTRCLVLGPEDSRTYVRRAGATLVPADEYGTFDAVVIGDDEGYPLLETLDAVVSMAFRAIDGGAAPHFVVPNPDLIYPKGDGRFGITSGALALVVEAALARRYGAERWVFRRLGKPNRPIYDEALRRLGVERAVVIGDQLQTDILGACRAGLDSALVPTGVSLVDDDTQLGEAVPTWLLPSLEEGAA